MIERLKTKARKNRIKRGKAYKRGEASARKEYSIKLKNYRNTWDIEIRELRKNTARHLKEIRLAYKIKEENFIKAKKGLSSAITYWAQQGEAVKAMNSKTYSLLCEYDETISELLKKSGKLTVLKIKLKENISSLYDKIEKIMRDEPNFIN